MRTLAVLCALVLVACASNADDRSTSADQVVAAQQGDAGTAAPPTYAEIAPIVESTCAGCHGTQFNTLLRVKMHRDEMIDLVSNAQMPKDDDQWFRTEDGQKFLKFLREAPEVQGPVQ